MINNLRAFVGKQMHSKPINYVLVTPTHVVATDSYKLIELEQKNEEITEPAVLCMPSEIKTFERVTKQDGKYSMLYKGGSFPVTHVADAKDYPKYDTLFPRKEDEPKVTFHVSVKHLADIVDAFKSSKQLSIEIEARAPNKPIIMRGKGMRVILMPIVK